MMPHLHVNRATGGGDGSWHVDSECFSICFNDVMNR